MGFWKTVRDEITWFDFFGEFVKRPVEEDQWSSHLDLCDAFVINQCPFGGKLIDPTDIQTRFQLGNAIKYQINLLRLNWR
jgi:hypothetical protein